MLLGSSLCKKDSFGVGKSFFLDSDELVIICEDSFFDSIETLKN